jgi:shikimate dehydrogenase
LNYFYLPIEVTAEDLSTVAAGIARMNFAGYNITIPHKIRIMDCLDAIDPLAQSIGAVNTVILENGHTTGYNTDGEGFVRSLETESGISVGGKCYFIIGSGGAARAIAMTLAFRGAEKIFLCNRTEQKAHDLAAEINAKVSPCSEVIPWSPRASQAPSGRRTCSSTPPASACTRRRPDSHRRRSDSQRPGRERYRLQSGPDETAAGGRMKKGCQTVPGLGMLVYQGAEAFRMWTGVEPPVDVMFEVVRALKG